jgi:DNA-binding CsgD family transcriptional regulator/PAS domain-containing protein
MRDFDRLVGAIYDCAADPDLWPEALAQIRNAVGGAYALVGFVDTADVIKGRPPFVMRRNSAWDESWLLKLEETLTSLPGGGGLQQDIDKPWTQLTQSPEDEFQKTEFYLHWVKPQGLRDTINTPYIQRDSLKGMLSVPSYATREPYAEADCLILERLSPHVRRAVLINDLTDKGRMALTLYKQVLDNLSVAVFVMGSGRRITFANASGEALLSSGDLLSVKAGVLQVRRNSHHAMLFDDAVERAISGEQALGIKGIGVPLLGASGERAAAYVLPLSGGDARRALGVGHCAVFVARRGEQQPMAVEVLRTLFDLTAAEARVSLLVAKGENPQMIAEGTGISVNTVRTHLKHSFAKTRCADQISLAGLVNGLFPPLV